MSAKKAEKAEGGGKKSPMPMIIGAVVLIVVLYFAKGAMGGKKEEDKGDKKEKKKHEKAVVGEYVPLEPDFTVNMAGGGDHYLKAAVSLGMKKDVTEETLKHHLAPIRDAIVTILSAKKIQDLATAKSKEALKDEIKEKLNDITDDAVVEICFTSFATQ